MSKGFLLALVAGLLVMGALVYGVFYAKRGAHLEPSGSVLKLRAAPVDDTHSVAVMDLRIVNDSDVEMVVRQIAVTLETKDGHQLDGALISGADSLQIFIYYPILGERYNEPLLARDKIHPRQTTDRMLAVRFDTTAAEVESRRKVSIEIEDASGTSFRLTEKAK